MSIITKVRIGLDGQPLAVDSTAPHVAVLLPQIDWMLTSTFINPGKAAPQKTLITAAKKIEVLGFKDWELAPIELLKLATDHTRYSPAFDPELFPGIPLDWIWSSTDCEWSKNSSGVASSAWLVNSYYGDVYDGPRGGNGFGLAARRVGQ